jgi:hypothetical protein
MQVNRQAIIVAITLQTLLTGCATSSGVLKMGPDTYTVSVGASPARGGVIGAKKMAYEEASKECMKTNKEMLIKNEESERTTRAAQSWLIVQAIDLFQMLLLKIGVKIELVVFEMIKITTFIV